MKLHSPGHLSPDTNMDTAGHKESHPEKERYPTQLYRHIKVAIIGSVEKQLQVLPWQHNSCVPADDKHVDFVLSSSWSPSTENVQRTQTDEGNTPQGLAALPSLTLQIESSEQLVFAFLSKVISVGSQAKLFINL